MPAPAACSLQKPPLTDHRHASHIARITCSHLCASPARAMCLRSSPTGSPASHASPATQRSPHSISFPPYPRTHPARPYAIALLDRLSPLPLFRILLSCCASPWPIPHGPSPTMHTPPPMRASRGAQQPFRHRQHSHRHERLGHGTPGRGPTGVGEQSCVALGTPRRLGVSRPFTQPWQPTTSTVHSMGRLWPNPHTGNNTWTSRTQHSGEDKGKNDETTLSQTCKPRGGD